MIARLYAWFTRAVQPCDPYEYGHIGTIRARRHRRTGEVQFVLWHAGEQGHTSDFWHRMGDGWAEYFIADIDTSD